MALMDINPDVLEEKANELDRMRQQDEEIMRQMRVLVMNLNEVWQGESEQAFVNKFMSQQKSMDAMQSTLKDYANEARRAASEARRLDNTLLGLLRKFLHGFF
ncbi:MAG: WXG100 family type VII secretion target [Lachnospiraceae bacterium]|nr:WXG100 family type VII secretion target [Lachnospiraceae bacterium]